MVGISITTGILASKFAAGTEFIWYCPSNGVHIVPAP